MTDQSQWDLVPDTDELLQALPVIAVQVDADFRLKSVNRSESRIFRQNPTPGDRLEEVFRGRTVGAIATLIDRAQKHGSAVDEIDTGSELFWVTAKRLESAPVTLVVFQDRTSLNRAEQALVDLVAERSSFLADVSHQLRSPLTAVLAYASLLAGPSADLDEGARGAMVQAMTDNAWSLAGLVEDLLALARSEIGELRVGRVPVNLSANVAQVLESMGGRGGGVEVIGDRSISGIGDPAGFRQIARNMLTNALTHGSDPVTVEITLSDSAAAMSVTDRGPGLPDDLVVAIFDQHLAGGELYAQGKVGVGLWVARELAGIMGGRIAYRRQSGETIFTATLPRREQQ